MLSLTLEDEIDWTVLLDDDNNAMSEYGRRGHDEMLVSFSSIFSCTTS
jgi:hypothetical protein